MLMQHYQNKTLPPVKRENWNHPSRYRPSPGLADAFDVSLELSMPLILTGEAGAGKTQFAHHIADHFGMGEALVFNAKTTSTATDLFYRYQAVKHFQYIQNKQEQEKGLKSTEDFIEYQALGLAIKRAQEKGERSVVLIDEIDKAPRDFPNDILNELEYLRFEVPELDQSFQAPQELRPIIIMTSNSEKNLPAPFLRRCVYFNIDFPKREELYEIIRLKLGDEEMEGSQLQKLIAEFEAIRELARQANTKKPATAELISWLAVLRQMEFDADTLGTPAADRKALRQSYTVLAKSDELRLALEKRLDSWR